MVKQRPEYNTKQILQLAVIVDNKQGFIKSGFGYYDRETEQTVYDNKTAIMNYMQGLEQLPAITDEVNRAVDDITDGLRDELIAKKLSGTLNSFEDSVLKAISNVTTDSFGVSIIASLPNSFRVQKKRQTLEDWFDSLRDKSEFVGKIGERVKMEVIVKDVKYIAKFGIHLVTCINKDNNIVKFFFNKEPDIAGILEGKTVKLTGKIKTHDVSKFSNCKETVFNYVKIEEI